MAPALPKGFTARSATLEDVEAAVGLVNACSIELIGRPEWTADQIRTDWQSPSLNVETDLRLVFAPRGQLVGYAGMWDLAPHVLMRAWANVHPEHRSQGIGTYLAQWLEERAWQSISHAPPGARVVIHQDRISTDTVAQRLLRAQGYQSVRYSFQMLIEMDEPPPVPVAPEGLTIRPLIRGQEERATLQAMREAFKGHWGYVEPPFEEDYQQWMDYIENAPDCDPSLLFVALDDAKGEIAGTCFGHPEMAEDPELGFVFGLGVRQPWRRRGLGLALLQHCFGALYRSCKRKVGLNVDAQNPTGAIRLYEKAGMHIQRQSNVYEKELRPGKDLSE
jgi:mycothiol synthase